MKTKKPTFLFLLAVILLAALPACASQANNSLSMAPLDQMAPEVRSAAVPVQQAYRFAVANADTMKQVPCYCGCAAMGHTSNYSCYVSKVGANGEVTFDDHALGCSLCVDITQDVMRLQRDGKPIQEIRSFIDSTYSKYGPSNIQ